MFGFLKNKKINLFFAFLIVGLFGLVGVVSAETCCQYYFGSSVNSGYKDYTNDNPSSVSSAEVNTSPFLYIPVNFIASVLNRPASGCLVVGGYFAKSVDYNATPLSYDGWLCTGTQGSDTSLKMKISASKEYIAWNDLYKTASGAAAGTTPPGTTDPKLTIKRYGNKAPAEADFILPDTAFLNQLNTTDPKVVMGRIISFVMGFSGTIALLMMIYGGFLWMTAMGNAENQKKSIQIIMWATLGIVIIFSSYALISFFLGVFPQSASTPESANSTSNQSTNQIETQALADQCTKLGSDHHCLGGLGCNPIKQTKVDVSCPKDQAGLDQVCCIDNP